MAGQNGNSFLPPEIQNHPCHYAKSYMAVLLEVHQDSELPLALKEKLHVVNNAFAFRRIQGLQQILAFLNQLAVAGEREGEEDRTSSLTAPKGKTSAARVFTRAKLVNSDISNTVFGSSNFVRSALQGAFPRRDANLRLAGVAPAPQLSSEEALHWTTLSMFDSAPVTPFHAVSYNEQELALRVVQGLCVLIPGQRRVTAEGSLLPIVIDSFLALRQRTEVVLKQQQLNGGEESTNASMTSTATGGVVLVMMENAEKRVFLAMLDALEAALHYSPHCLQNFVALHGIKRLMPVAQSPHIPVDIRVAILHFFCVLINETGIALRILQERASEASVASSSPTSTSSASDFTLWADRVSVSKFYHCLLDYLREHVPGGGPDLILAWSQLVNFNGVAVPSHLNRSEQASMIQEIHRKRTKTFETFLQQMEWHRGYGGNTNNASVPSHTNAPPNIG